MWQANTQQHYFIEDTLCQLFKDFLNLNNIPLIIDSFEYQDNNLLERGYSKAEILEKILHVNSYNEDYNVDTIQIISTSIEGNPTTRWRKGDNPGPEIYEIVQPYGMFEKWYNGEVLHRIHGPAESKYSFDGTPIEGKWYRNGVEIPDPYI